MSDVSGAGSCSQSGSSQRSGSGCDLERASSLSTAAPQSASSSSSAAPHSGTEFKSSRGASPKPRAGSRARPRSARATHRLKFKAATAAKPSSRRSHRRRKTPSCIDCAAAKVRCVGGPPCARCKKRGTPETCQPVTWPRRGVRRLSPEQATRVLRQNQKRALTGQTSPHTWMVMHTTSVGSIDAPSSASGSAGVSKPAAPVASPRVPPRRRSDPTEIAREMTMASQTSPFGVVVLPWDPLPFLCKGSPWVNRKIALWLGFTQEALATAFNSYLGLCHVMDEPSVIQFLGRLFNALNDSARTFNCSMALICHNRTRLHVQCMGTIQYAPVKTIFLQLCLPVPVQQPALPLRPPRAARTAYTPESRRRMLPGDSDSLMTASPSPSPVESFSSMASPWVIDPSPALHADMVLSSLLSQPVSSTRDIVDEYAPGVAHSIRLQQPRTQVPAHNLQLPRSAGTPSNVTFISGKPGGAEDPAQ